MLEFIAQHQFSAAVAIYWIFSAAVDSLPDPGTAVRFTCGCTGSPIRLRGT